MKLQQLAAKPKLLRAVIDDEKTIEAHGEEIEFWMYDRADLDTYFELANVDEKNFASLAKVVSKLVLDETGQPILQDGKVLPIELTIKIIEIAVKALGNSVSQTLNK